MADQPEQKQPGPRLEPPPAVAGGAAFGRALSASERKHLVLAAASRLFEQHGFHGTSIQQIADEVGVTKAAIYHYVASKEQLLFEIHDAFITTILEEADSVYARTEDPREQIEAIVQGTFRAVADYRPYVRAFFRDFNSLSSEWQAEIKTKRDRYEELVEDSLRRGGEQGIFSLHVEPKLGAFFLFGACNWSYQWMRLGSGIPAPEVLAEQWTAMLMKAFAPD